ncbi:signal peptidase I [Nocardiopsis rhodophaea]|uniref:Signal peptidase I n=2 Tax=Nocardiopsis rhodophaea TaxID=280238 RepID=A0ABP5EMD7_9ACTN
MSNEESQSRPDGQPDAEADRSESGGPTDDTGSPMTDHGGARVISGGTGNTASNEGPAADAADTEESVGKTMSAKNEGSKEKQGSFWKELPILIVIALVLAFVIKTWVVQAFYIPSKSMEETLLVGDRVLVNKLVYQVRDIKRGDVVVFNGSGSWDEGETVVVEEPTNPVSRLFTWVGQQLGVQPTGKDYIKRVIALPGDTVACCDAKNRVTVNGVPLNEEDYLFPGSAATESEFGPVTVPKGRVWLMGDHRSISYDSRLHQNDPGEGSVAIDSVVGRAFVIVWPLDRWGTLPIPDTFDRLNDETEGGEESASGSDVAGEPDIASAPVAAAALPFAPLALGTAAAVPLHLGGRSAQRALRRRFRRSHAGDSGD